MTADTAESRRILALERIGDAFAERPRPSVMTTSMQLSDLELEEVMAFEGMRWQDVPFDHVERHAGAVFGFAPEAFCYYLPGFLAACLREGRWDSNVCDSLINMLDRSPVPDYWDDFFLPRWTRLSAAELDAVAAWASWLELVRPDVFANTYDRVQETLRLLKARVGHVPRP